jgi:hypothetical protein
MESLTKLLSGLIYTHVLWLFVVAFMIHELEEWHIADFERRNFVGLPEWHTALNARMWIAAISMIAVVWCATATIPGIPRVAAYVFLPAMMLAAGNAVQHLIWTLLFRQYAPGLGTGLLMVLPLSIYLVIRAVNRQYVSLWYVAVLAVLIGVVLLRTVAEGNRANGMIRAIYRVGGQLAHLLRLGGNGRKTL